MPAPKTKPRKSAAPADRRTPESPPLPGGRREEDPPSVQVVAITGVANPWGSALLAELEKDSRIRKVVGIDVGRPGGRFRKTTFHTLANRDPRMVEVLAREGVQAVCHLDFQHSYFPDDELFDRNVLGTMFLLSAAANAGVKRVVIRSRAQIYGARADNPNFLTEDMPIRPRSGSQYVRDLREVEKYAREFGLKHAEMAVVTLRIPGCLGPRIRTLMSQYLSGRAVPAMMGFDPPFQILHEDDALGAMKAALVSSISGPVNVAAEPLLSLATIIARAGGRRVPVPGEWAWPFVDLAARRKLGDFCILPPEYLKYQCVVDTRRMREELRFFPKHTADETLEQFALLRGAGRAV